LLIEVVRDAVTMYLMRGDGAGTNVEAIEDAVGLVALLTMHLGDTKPSTYVAVAVATAAAKIPLREADPRHTGEHYTRSFVRTCLPTLKRKAPSDGTEPEPVTSAQRTS
jgi:hypothetical protein